MGTPWWNMPSRGILGSMIWWESRGGLRGEQGPQAQLCGRGDVGFGCPGSQRYSPAPGRRGNPGTWPTPGPGRPGRNPRPRRATLLHGPGPCAPLCRRRGDRGVSCAPTGDSTDQARGGMSAVLTAVPHASPCAHGVGFILRPRCVLAAVLGEVHAGEGGLPSALLGGRCAVERRSGAGGRSHFELPETTFERTSLVGHRGSWAPITGPGTGKDWTENSGMVLLPRR